MEITLKAYLTSMKDTSVEIWVAVDGVIVSGCTSNFEEYWVYANGMYGDTERQWTEIYRQAVEENNPNHEMHITSILFSKGDVFMNGQKIHSGPVSVNAERVGAWGLGAFTPEANTRA